MHTAEHIFLLFPKLYSSCSTTKLSVYGISPCGTNLKPSPSSSTSSCVLRVEEKIKKNKKIFVLINLMVCVVNHLHACKNLKRKISISSICVRYSFYIFVRSVCSACLLVLFHCVHVWWCSCRCC